jgi:peptidoglycan/xylan/chitin deacetylase (PgdA/CDA1 family)
MRTTHKQVTSEGILIEGFEGVSDWTISGTGGTKESTSNCKSGSSALKVNFVSTAFTFCKKLVSLDLSTSINFIFWIYIADITTTQYIQVSFSSDSFSTKSFKIQLGASLTNELLTGWNRIVVDKTKFTNTGSDSWSNIMNAIQVVVTGVSGQSSYVIFDDLRYNYTARPKVILSFDDANQNQYDNALPILTGNNQKGVFFVPHAYLDNSTFLTTNECKSLFAAGHDVCNHTWSHYSDITALSQSDMQYEIKAMNDFLFSNGITTKVLAYPYYIYNNNVIKYLNELDYQFARSGYPSIYQPHINYDSNLGQYIVRCIQMDSTVTAVTVNGYIDQLINQGGLLVITMHEVVTSGATGISTLASTLQTISNYLKSKSDANVLDVITFSQYFNDYQYPVSNSQLSPVQTTIEILKESGLIDVDIKAFMAIVYNSLTKNQNVESNISYTNSNYLNYYVSVVDKIDTFNNQDLIELSVYIS